jgi:amino acid transporter
MEKRGLLERDSHLYITRLFKSRWQPLPAYTGIIGCGFVVLWSGVPSLYALIARRGLTSTSVLRKDFAFILDIAGYYFGVCCLESFTALEQ